MATIKELREVFDVFEKYTSENLTIDPMRDAIYLGPISYDRMTRGEKAIMENAGGVWDHDSEGWVFTL